MRPGTVTVRPSRPGDEPGILRVLDKAFGGWPRFDVHVPPLDHLRWQLEGYHAQELAHFVAEVDERIAAVEMAYIREFKARHRLLTAWVGTDGATHPDFQGRGVYSVLENFRREETRTHYDLRTGQTTNPVIKRLHATEQGRIAWGNRLTLLLKVYDGKRLALAPGPSSRGIRSSVPARRFAFEVLHLLGSMRTAIRRQQRERTLAIIPVTEFDERFDVFWEQASEAFDFIGTRRKDFLRWRYADRRAGEHTVLAAEGPGQILGYTALRTQRQRGQILDMLTLPDRADVADSLIAAALGHFKRQGCSAVQFITVAEHPYNQLFARHGFFDMRPQVDFYCGALRIDEGDLAFLSKKDASVHLTDGDLV